MVPRLSNAVIRLTLAIFLSTLTGCCGKFFTGPNDLVGITVAPTNGSIQPGATQQFTATGTFQDNSGPTGDVTAQTTWTSSDPAIATIDPTGLATGVAFGTVTIKGHCQCFNSDVTLTVGSQTITLTSIAVTPNNPTISVGRTQQFTAIATFSNNTTSNITNSVTWSSSSTSVATIDNTGLATAVTAGNTAITATSGTVSGNTTLTVQ